LDLIAIEGLLDSFNLGGVSYQSLNLVFGVQFVEKMEEIATNVARRTGSIDSMVRLVQLGIARLEGVRPTRKS
jgi:hypothetical protein